ncbi:MAG: DUF3795 domain-containing protein [Thermodesulfobacteriota bacterium]
MIAYCGLDCERCEAFIATKNDDDALREKVAKEWSALYGTTITADAINCTGCLSNGIKTYYCEHMCPIRPCAKEKGLATCAQCDDFPCNQLQEVFKLAPEAERRLRSLRTS